MATTVEKFILQAKSWVGLNEATGGHKEIIDLYNANRASSCGYEMNYDSQWCAAFVSACSIECGIEHIVPVECHCNHMIKKFEDMGVWIEDESIVPQVGDIVFYDWQNSGDGDNKGSADHVGIVETVNEQAGTFTAIEGNYKKSVKRRRLKFDAACLRGFARPNYEQEFAEESEEAPAETPAETPSETPSEEHDDKNINTSFLKKLVDICKILAQLVSRWLKLKQNTQE